MSGDGLAAGPAAAPSVPPRPFRRAARPSPPPPRPVDRWLVSLVRKGLGPLPARMLLWDGSVWTLGNEDEPVVADLVMRDRRALFGLVRHPSLCFGESYVTGALEVRGDLLAFLEAVYRRWEHTPYARRAEKRWRHRKNDVRAARENVHHHYDLGNEFYRLWLDPELLYTCAYYPTPGSTLDEAQTAKMEHVCRKLRLRPGESVVEAGCGWGALALHMARHYGVRVRAYNISHEQIVYARARAMREGLAGRVEYVEEDYRNIDGHYDAFVSVGMLEHVGLRNYRTLGAVVQRCLASHGRGLIHSIGRNYPARLQPWIEKRIFPGAYPPALGEMTHIFEPWNLSILDVENLRLHYAQTLRHWLALYEGAADRVREMFDDKFVRMWRLYLAGSVAAFTTGTLQLFQVVFAPGENNDVAWTRAHLYPR